MGESRVQQSGVTKLEVDSLKTVHIDNPLANGLRNRKESRKALITNTQCQEWHGQSPAGSHRNSHYNKTPYVNKLENIIDTDKFLEKYNMLKLTQEEK